MLKCFSLQSKLFSSCFASSSVSTQTDKMDEESPKHLQLPKPVKRSISTVSFNLPEEKAENTSSGRRSGSMLHNFRGSMLSIASARSIIGTTRDILSQWFVVLGIVLFVIVVVTYNLLYRN